MPELAEVEFYRRQWNAGLGQRVTGVEWHAWKRIFRGVDQAALAQGLVGARFRHSETHGKRMAFHFTPEVWLGVHLGMTGSLRVEEAGFQPGKHDHLVLRQKRQTLVFSDPRQFGRVQFHQGANEPDWWKDRPPPLLESAFTVDHLRVFLGRHARLPLKGALLLQDGFPGIGNWMADEILWRAGLRPHIRVGQLTKIQSQRLWRITRWVARGAMRHISPAFDDPPKGWFFNERWSGRRCCPRHRTPLLRAKICGRTTVWCSLCQK